MSKMKVVRKKICDMMRCNMLRFLLRLLRFLQHEISEMQQFVQNDKNGSKYKLVGDMERCPK